MKQFAIQISPEAKSAYFAEYQAVAQQELLQSLHGVAIASKGLELLKIGSLEFFVLELPEDALPLVANLSFVLGVFEYHEEGLIPLDLAPTFLLHDDFVFGSKFKGKTNERLTQMLINVGLSYLDSDVKDVRLLDPMCGRATTLLWAMRYGISAVGIEQDSKALGDIQRNVKKWCKVHRQKHKFDEGYVSRANKKKTGPYVQFSVDDHSMKVITGDARVADTLLGKQRFNLIVSDLPYGVQHFTTEKTRNPNAVLESCLPVWKSVLAKDGVMVLAYNRYLPKRETFTKLAEEAGLNVVPFEVPHRMSESIVRDLIVLTHGDG